MAALDAVCNVPRSSPRTLERKFRRRTASDWALGVERGPNWLFVKVLGGLVDVSHLPPLGSRLRTLLEQNLINRMVLELEQAIIPCSYLVRQLTLLDRWVAEYHGLLRLCGLRTRYAERLRRRGLSDRFVFYHDRREAVFGVSRPRSPLWTAEELAQRENEGHQPKLPPR